MILIAFVLAKHFSQSKFSLINLRYELILSYSKKQQYKLAKYCDDCLGDMLLREPLPNYSVRD